MESQILVTKVFSYCCCEWLFTPLSFFAWRFNCDDFFTVYMSCLRWHYVDVWSFLFFFSFLSARPWLPWYRGLVCHAWLGGGFLDTGQSTPLFTHRRSNHTTSAPRLDDSAETWVWTVDVNLLPEAAASRRRTAGWGCRPRSVASPTAC